MDVQKLIEGVPGMRQHHSREDQQYQQVNLAIKDYFKNYNGEVLDIEPFQGVVWPRVDLGNLNSFDYFSLDDYIKYMFYKVNRNRYKVVFDVGANLGIDTLLFDKLGFEVHAFEPDPDHLEILKSNLSKNESRNVRVHPVGLSDKAETVDFIRVKGNTSANHIVNDRDFYGDYDKVQIKTITYPELGIRPDFMKINVEGHEKNIIRSIPVEEWRHIDAMIEVHNVENQTVIYETFKDTDIKMFSQKLNWAEAKCLEDIPKINKEGYVFITSANDIPWTE